MKKNYKIVRRLVGSLLGLAFVGTISAGAPVYTLTDADVVVTNGVITACSYDFTIKDIVIPSTLDGQTVTATGYDNPFSSTHIFMGKGITSVTLPSTLKVIGENSFKSNDLLSITIPNGVTTIGESAFSFNDANFVSITLPASVTSIGKYAFGNNGITTITLPVSVPSGANASFVCWLDGTGTPIVGGATVTYNSYYRSKIVYTLSDADVVVDAQGIITSCSYDFTTGYKDLAIPSVLDGQTVLGIKNETYGGVFGDNGLLSVSLPSTIKTIGGYAFANNDLTQVDIPATVVTIGDYAFYNNTLADLALPSGLGVIGASAFRSNDLISVVLPASVINIGAAAFYFNDFTDLVLPTPLNNEYQVWVGTDKVDYTVGATVQVNTGLGFSAKITHTLTDDEVTVTNGSIVACSYDFTSKYIVIPSVLDGQTVVAIANGIEEFGWKVTAIFKGKGIKEISLPSSLTSIGDYAFYENELTSLSIPSNVTYIGIESFMLNNSLASNPIFPTPTKNGYTFSNWKSASGTTYAAGASIPNSFDVSFTAQFTTGTSLNSLDDNSDKVNIYPNPFDNGFNIVADGVYDVEIYNVLGGTLYHKMMEGLNQFVDLNGMPSGVYILRTTDVFGTSYSKKIVKN